MRPQHKAENYQKLMLKLEISLSQRAIPFGYPSFAFPREQSPIGYTNRVVIYEIIYTITTPNKIIIITIMIKEKETINLGRGGEGHGRARRRRHENFGGRK